MILAGRRNNDSMGFYVAGQVIKAMTKKHIPIAGAKVILLGFAFKGNCPGIRNTRVIDVYNELKDYETEVDVFDP